MPALMFLAPLLLSAAGVASPVPGTVAIALADPVADDPAGDQPYADAVGQALGEAAFTVMPGTEHSRYVARVAVRHERRGVVTVKGARARPNALVGGGGPAVVLPLGSGKTQLRDLVTTTLTVRLVSRADDRLVWSGSAVTVQVDGAPIQAKLARAAVATFPQTLSAPVPVP